MWTVHPPGVLHFTRSCESSGSVCYLQHCLKPQVSVTVWGRQECTSGTNMLCRKGKEMGWGGRMGACNHGDRDIRGVEGWWGFPCKLIMARSVIERGIHAHAHTHAHTQISLSHIMTTSIHTSFRGLGVETGKQAEGGKFDYSASHSKSEPWLQPISYPSAATETQSWK